MPIELTGLGSGFDWKPVVEQLIQLERVPQIKIQDKKEFNTKEQTAIGELKTRLESLQKALDDLKESKVFHGRTTAVIGDDLNNLAFTAQADNEALTGSYDFNVIQLATKSIRTGTSNIGAGLNTTNDVSGLTIELMNTNTPITEGDFSINGKTVSIKTTDSLQDVFDAISTATSGDVTASYDATTDKITLSSASEIILGTPADSSNFLAATKLYSNGTDTVSSQTSLGSANLNTAIDQAKLGIAISAGTFTVNGSPVTVNATDSMQDIFDAISTATGASVTASYDSGSETITLSSGSAITLGDLSDTSNFLSAAKLTANGTGTVESSAAIGPVNLSNTINTYHLSTPFGQNFSTGTFTVNGNVVTINAGDTLDNIFTAIATATSGAVTASYSSSTNKISLSSSSTITLADLSDTSNFLTLAQLSSDDDDPQTSLISGGKLGNLDTTTAIESLTVTGGSFKINGQTITYDSASDSISTVIARINASKANANMAYDALNDRFIITNSKTGSFDVSVEDTSSILMEAMGLSSTSALTQGVNAQFTVNGGGTLTSTSNSFDSTSHGITGLTVTGKKTGVTETVEVTANPTKTREKIEAFIEKFNIAQSYIAMKTKTTVETDKNGKTVIKKEDLSDYREANNIARSLRTKAFKTVDGLSGNVTRLADIGIDFKKGSNELEIKDADLLEKSLKNEGSAVAQLFTQLATTDESSDPDQAESERGLNASLNKLIDAYVDFDGLFKKQTDIIAAANKRFDDQIAQLERKIKAEEARLKDSFLKMELAQQKISTQSQIMAAKLGGIL